jgi:hypothetical protein
MPFSFSLLVGIKALFDVASFLEELVKCVLVVALLVLSRQV